jgi:hypothetical protein
MDQQTMDRKRFLSTVGRIGACACMCAAVSGMSAALAADAPEKKPEGQPAAGPEAIPETHPGEKTLARGAKRMEFAEGWVKRFFDAVDQTLDEPTRLRLMEANGKACFIAYAGPPKGKPEADAVEKFTRWVAEHGKEQGYSVENGVFFVEYTSSAETGKASPENLCLCPMVESKNPGGISKTFCLCSVGYVKELHERKLGRTVKVDLLDSVLLGGSRCRFRITAV